MLSDCTLPLHYPLIFRILSRFSLLASDKYSLCKDLYDFKSPAKNPRPLNGTYRAFLKALLRFFSDSVLYSRNSSGFESRIALPLPIFPSRRVVSVALLDSKVESVAKFQPHLSEKMLRLYSSLLYKLSSFRLPPAHFCITRFIVRIVCPVFRLNQLQNCIFIFLFTNFALYIYSSNLVFFLSSPSIRLSYSIPFVFFVAFDMSLYPFLLILSLALYLFFFLSCLFPTSISLL